MKEIIIKRMKQVIADKETDLDILRSLHREWTLPMKRLASLINNFYSLLHLVQQIPEDKVAAFLGTILGFYIESRSPEASIYNQMVVNNLYYIVGVENLSEEMLEKITF